MDRFIIEQSGFPKNRETLKRFQEQFTKPIDALIKLFPGNRVLDGFEITDNLDGTMTSTAGLIKYNNKLYSIDAYDGVNETTISLFEVTEDFAFNTGTPEAPQIENEPGSIVRTATVGDDPGADVVIAISSIYSGRKVTEYLLSSTTFIGSSPSITGYNVYDVNFGQILSTDDYFVLGRLRPQNVKTVLNESIQFTTRELKNNKFTLVIKNEDVTENLFFDFVLLCLNSVNQIISNP